MRGRAALRIRAGGFSDAAAIAALIRRAFAVYEGKLQPPAGASSETAETIGAKLLQERALVADGGEEIVACLFFQQAREAGGVYVGRVAVAPEHQGRGLAARLMAELERLVRSEGAVALTLHARIALPANRALFEKLGFRAVGEGTHGGFDRPTFTIMRKEL